MDSHHSLKVRPKPAIIHCIRHAQGFHNLGPQFHCLADPRLTPLGEKQVIALRESLGPDFLSRIRLVTASPLSRTLHTAAIAFEPILKKEGRYQEQSRCKPQILAVAEAQETSDYPCDTGSDRNVLAKECEEFGWPVDLSRVPAGWNYKGSPDSRWGPGNDSIAARARDTRRLLRERVKELRNEVGSEHEKDQAVEIVMVSHGGWLHYFTQDWEGAFNTYGTGWKNCEVRSYQFVDELDDTAERDLYQDQGKVGNDPAYLVETTESRRRRGLSHPMPDRKKQKELFWETMTGWEAQGLQTPISIQREMEEKLKRQQQNGEEEEEEEEKQTQTQTQNRDYANGHNNITVDDLSRERTLTNEEVKMTHIELDNDTQDDDNMQRTWSVGSIDGASDDLDCQSSNTSLDEVMMDKTPSKSTALRASA